MNFIEYENHIVLFLNGIPTYIQSKDFRYKEIKQLLNQNNFDKIEQILSKNIFEEDNNIVIENDIMKYKNIKLPYFLSNEIERLKIEGKDLFNVLKFITVCNYYDIDLLKMDKFKGFVFRDKVFYYDDIDVNNEKLNKIFFDLRNTKFFLTAKDSSNVDEFIYGLCGANSSKLEKLLYEKIFNEDSTICNELFFCMNFFKGCDINFIYYLLENNIYQLFNEGTDKGLSKLRNVFELSNDNLIFLFKNDFNSDYFFDSINFLNKIEQKYKVKRINISSFKKINSFKKIYKNMLKYIELENEIQDFYYGDKISSLFPHINEKYKIELAKNSLELMLWSMTMNNCIHSYAGNSKNILLAVYVNNKMKYNIQINEGSIRQFERIHKTRIPDDEVILKNEIVNFLIQKGVANSCNC